MYQMIANHVQLYRLREAVDNGAGSFQDKRRNMIRCLECGTSWGSLLELQRGGGQVQSLGLKLEATCPGCGCAWGVNQHWQKLEVISD